MPAKPTNPKITGTWIGEYVYGDEDGYAEAGVAGRSVPFTMSLTESWLARFAGYVRDDAERGGQPERGRVRGRRRGRAVRFRKIFPVGYVFDDNGDMVELREYLRRHDAEPAGELPPHCIDYRGEFGADGETMRGEWRIVIAGEETATDGGTGSWHARRTSFDPSAV